MESTYQSSIFQAAVEGDTKLLNDAVIAKFGEEILQFRSPDLGNNIVQIAARQGHWAFIDKAISRFPDLLQQKNNKGNTPLHEVAAMGAKESVEHLISLLKKSLTNGSTATAAADMVQYLLETNEQGDNPFHVAIRSRNVAAAEGLLAFTEAETPQLQILLISNDFGESPLDLYIQYCAGGVFPENLNHDENHNEVYKPKLMFRLIKAANYEDMFEYDSEGLNPLMRAAKYGRVLLVNYIVVKYYQSIDCRDSKGKSFLHHLRLRMSDLNARDKEYTLFICNKILQLRGVDTLTFCRDNDGNTPLHLAIIDGDFDLLQLILQRLIIKGRDSNLKDSNARKELILNLRNNDGKTIFDLPGIPSNLNKLMEQAIQGRIMDKKIHDAAECGNKDVFIQRTDDAPFLSQDVDGKNILHIALEHEHVPFIEDAIDNFPKLIYQKDSNGDTPLHAAARLQSDAAYRLLKKSLHYWYDNCRQDYWLTLRVPPWKLKNSRGYTPLHEAAYNCRYRNLRIMTILLKTLGVLSEAVSDVNQNDETVLHLIARYNKKPDVVEDPEGDKIYNLYEVLHDCKTAVHMRDIDGLTPILRAAHSGQIWLVTKIAERHPKSTSIIDYKGRTILHHLCTSVLNDENELECIFNLFKQGSKDSSAFSRADDLMFSKDYEGNTPLHLAIINQNFKAAHYFIRYYIKVDLSSKLHELLEIKNNEGMSIRNMIITCGSDNSLSLKKVIESSASTCTMDDIYYTAAKNGSMDIFSGDIDKISKKLYSQVYDGSNVIHIALRLSHLAFINEVLNNNLELIYWKDNNGDTPLHLAAGLQTSVALQFVNMCLSHWKEQDFSINPPPWTVRNSKGNTFLHEAARFCNYEVISLPSIDYNYIKDVNDHGETVLHVIARYATSTENLTNKGGEQREHNNVSLKGFLGKFSELTKSLVYMRDFEGYTPVLRAVKCGRLGMARFLIKQYPQSVGIPDYKGRTILHHMGAQAADLVDDLKDIMPVWKNIFEIREVDALRIAQDEDGNTPLHFAISNDNFIKSKFLMEMCLLSDNRRELNFVNNDGLTIFDLVASRVHIPSMKELQPLVNRSRVKERELIKEMMDDELYIAAKKGELGDVGKRPPRDDEWFCRRTPGGSNIIHVVLRHANGNDKATAFVTTALSKWPILSMRQDNNGDTPLHLAAKWKTGVPMKLLVDASKKFLKQLDESEKAFHVAPWAVKNNKGSFPIHEALQADNLDGALDLLECDEEAAHRVNDLGETPLHAFAKYGFSIEKDEAKKFVKKLKGLSKDAAYLRDDEGLTPLLSAAKSGRFQVVQAILEYCPQSAYLRDSGGRTFLHLLRFTGEDVDESLANTFKNAGDQLFDIPEADTQRLVQDYEGSTPLHHAIRTGNSIAAIVLTQKCLKDEEQRELALVDKKGDTIPDLLASHDVPNEIITKIRKKVPKAVSLARSSYGIRKTEMKESANALSVVAALLATITFAAAFQVPGGFDGDDGSPVLLRKPAFIIFVIANTIAMCCSMLCLFLLLWVMGIGKMHGSLVVLDLCIHLLRASFYLTLLTFTMGVFVVTAKKSLWLAILVCGLCFVAFVLTFRRSINFLAKCINLTPEIKKNAKSIGEDSEKSPAIGNSAASDGIHVEINQFNTVVDLH